tara:strand:+ start:14114 stop:15466 length:1353 start_codon:yes stop_codon:yes gene_type:complete
MSRWQEQFDNHAVHQTLEQISEWLNIELDDLSDGDISEIRRFKNVMELLTKSIGELDVELVSIPQLDALNQQLRHQNIWNQINSFSSNGNVQHIANANNNLGPVTQYLTWLVPYTKAQGHNETISSLQNSVDQTVNALAKKKETLSEELTNLTGKVEELTKQKTQLETTIEQRRIEVDQQISQWQQQFSDAQEKRTESYNNWKTQVDTEIRGKTEDLVSTTRDEVESLETSTTDNLEQIHKDATEKHEEIKELFQLASGDSISGGYSQFADKERFQSNLWRTFAIGFICITAWWIFSAYKNINALPEPVVSHQVTIAVNAATATKDSTAKLKADNKLPIKVATKQFDWHKFLLSFSLTGVLLFGAAYSGQQSNRHRENEKRMRWFALQIKALDPYINSLEPEDQKELKKTLSEKFFNGAHEVESQSGLIDEHAIGVVAKAITDAIKAAKA